jgi:hypothetical protein
MLRQPIKMKVHILLYLFLLSNTILFGQDFETEIKNLKTNEEIEKYWLKIKEDDHNHRGRDRIDTNDNNNYKKSILTIKHHGFPANSKIPFVIAVHQASAFVNEYYFPIFYSAYQSGLADSSWFYHYLRGLYRNRFDRDLIRGRQIEDTDVDSILIYLTPFLKTTCDYSINPFDSLFNLYNSEISKITTQDTLSAWRNEDNDWIYLFKYADKTYFQKVWRDKSNGWPQEVKLFNGRHRYDFVFKTHLDYVLIENKKLYFIQEFRPTEVYSATP